MKISFKVSSERSGICLLSTSDGSPNSADTNISDGNPAYFRDKLLYSDGTNKSTYNIGFKLDILPKKLVLNGNASLYRYDYMVEKFNKAYQLENKDTNLSLIHI